MNIRFWAALAAAAAVAGCGSDSLRAVSGEAESAAFFASVAAIVDAPVSDTAEPIDIDTFTAAGSDTAEPTAI